MTEIVKKQSNIRLNWNLNITQKTYNNTRRGKNLNEAEMLRKSNFNCVYMFLKCQFVIEISSKLNSTIHWFI